MAAQSEPVGQAVVVMVMEEQAGQEPLVAQVHPAAVVMVRAVVVVQEPLALLEFHRVVEQVVLVYRIV